MRTRPTRSKSPELVRNIKRYVDEYNNRYLSMPSTSEIGKALGVTKTTVYRYLVYMNEKNMISYEGRSIVTHRISHKRNDIDVPLLVRIPCDSPEEQEDIITDYLSVPRSILGDGEFFALKVTDDSMVSADLRKGDIVIFRRDPDPKVKEKSLVAVLVNDGEGKLGHLIKNRKTQSVLFQTQSHKPDMYDSFEIQGVVVSVIKQLGQCSEK